MRRFRQIGFSSWRCANWFSLVFRPAYSHPALFFVSGCFVMPNVTQIIHHPNGQAITKATSHQQARYGFVDDRPWQGFFAEIRRLEKVASERRAKNQQKNALTSEMSQ